MSFFKEEASQDSRIGSLEGKVELMHETLTNIDAKVDNLTSDVSEIKGILQMKKEKRSFRRNLGIALAGAGATGLVTLLIALVMR